MLFLRVLEGPEDQSMFCRILFQGIYFFVTLASLHNAPKSKFRVNAEKAETEEDAEAEAEQGAEEGEEDAEEGATRGAEEEATQGAEEPAPEQQSQHTMPVRISRSRQAAKRKRQKADKRPTKGRGRSTPSMDERLNSSRNASDDPKQGSSIGVAQAAIRIGLRS
ncbi:MAG: hypothetical protein M1812_005506 [Candelaria pacifica]|nr:MAG: hypothetical protein M1812_005506 [Candelaria pacifica]